MLKLLKSKNSSLIEAPTIKVVNKRIKPDMVIEQETKLSFAILISSENAFKNYLIPWSFISFSLKFKHSNVLGRFLANISN